MPNRRPRPAVLARPSSHPCLVLGLAAVAASMGSVLGQSTPPEPPALRLAAGDVLTFQVRNRVEHRLEGRDQQGKAFPKDGGYRRTSAFDLRLSVQNGGSPQVWNLAGEITRVQLEVVLPSTKGALVIDSADAAKAASLQKEIPERTWQVSFQPLLALVGHKISLSLDSTGKLWALNGIDRLMGQPDANYALDHVSQSMLGANWTSSAWQQQFAAAFFGGVPPPGQRRLGSTWARDWIMAPTSPALRLAPGPRQVEEKPAELFTKMEPKGPPHPLVEPAPETWLCHGILLLAGSSRNGNVVYVTSGSVEQPSLRRAQEDARRRRREEALGHHKKDDFFSELMRSLEEMKREMDPLRHIDPYDEEAMRKMVEENWTRRMLDDNPWLEQLELQLELQPEPDCQYLLDGMLEYAHSDGMPVRTALRTIARKKQGGGTLTWISHLEVERTSPLPKGRDASIIQPALFAVDRQAILKDNKDARAAALVRDMDVALSLQPDGRFELIVLAASEDIGIDGMVAGDMTGSWKWDQTVSRLLFTPTEARLEPPVQADGQPWQPWIVWEPKEVLLRLRLPSKASTPPTMPLRVCGAAEIDAVRHRARQLDRIVRTQPAFLRDFDAWYTWITQPSKKDGPLRDAAPSRFFTRNAEPTTCLWQFTQKVVREYKERATDKTLDETRQRILAEARQLQVAAEGPDALRPEYLRDFDAWYSWITQKPDGLFGFLARTIDPNALRKDGDDAKQLWLYARKLVEGLPVDASEAAISTLRGQIVDAADDIKAGRKPGTKSR